MVLTSTSTSPKPNNYHFPWTTDSVNARSSFFVDPNSTWKSKDTNSLVGNIFAGGASKHHVWQKWEPHTEMTYSSEAKILVLYELTLGIHCIPHPNPCQPPMALHRRDPLVPILSKPGSTIPPQSCSKIAQRMRKSYPGSTISIDSNNQGRSKGSTPS